MVEESYDTSVKIIPAIQEILLNIISYYLRGEPSIEPIAAAKLNVTVDTEYVLNDDCNDEKEMMMPGGEVSTLLEIHSTPIQKEITNLCIAVAPAFSQTPEDSVSKLSVNP